MSACLCAADSSVIAISEQDEAQKRYRRVVIAADVERENLRELEVDEKPYLALSRCWWMCPGMTWPQYWQMKIKPVRM